MVPAVRRRFLAAPVGRCNMRRPAVGPQRRRSEEHTSELQSQSNLVCRLLLEKKKYTATRTLLGIVLGVSPSYAFTFFLTTVVTLPLVPFQVATATSLLSTSRGLSISFSPPII